MAAHGGECFRGWVFWGLGRAGGCFVVGVAVARERDPPGASFFEGSAGGGGDSVGMGDLVGDGAVFWRSWGREGGEVEILWSYFTT